MPTDSGCAPGICQGQPDYYGANCAGINGCDEQDGYSMGIGESQRKADEEYRRLARLSGGFPAEAWSLNAARAVVDKARADMRAENEATAERVMAWLDDAEPGVRRQFFMQYVEARRNDAAANDYAETRLREMQAQLEALASELSASSSAASDEGVRRGYNRAVKYAARKIREVARG